jgi:translation elongation factor EF-4
MKREDMLFVSAKTGLNCEQILEAIVRRMPCPSTLRSDYFRALVFDMVYHLHRGAIIFVACYGQEIKVGDRVTSCYTKKSYEVQEVGICRPFLKKTQKLYAGQVGYLICNIRNVKEALVGDTFHLTSEKKLVEPFPGFKVPKPMVFSSFYPLDSTNYDLLRHSIEKLAVNDSSVSLEMDSSPVLGQGYRIGFLGLLHMDIFKVY